MTATRIFTIALLLSGAAAVCDEDKEAPYIFTFDGKPFEPYVIALSGAPGKPQPGDLVWVRDMLLTLGPEKLCAFKVAAEKGKTARLLLVSPEGKETVVGVQVSWTYEDRKRQVINPLDTLSDSEIASLWGLLLDEWSDAIAQKVQKINPARTCVSLGAGAAMGKAKLLPSLPDGLVNLVVEERSNQGIQDYEPLSRLTRLKFLTIDSMTVRNLDSALLKDCAELQYLDLRRQNIRHPEALGALRSLRVLNLSWADEFQELSFAGGLSELRTLNVSRTQVRDLTPLSGLEHLVSVDANQAPIEKLPDGKLGALKSLKVMSSCLTAADVDAFRKAHPACKVEFGWDQAFRDAVAACTRLRVRSGGTCHRDPQNEKTLFEVKDAGEIARVVEQTLVVEKQSGFHCMCCGEPTFEFYNGDTLLVMAGFHHGRSLRWSEGWPADALLTPASATFYSEYLAAHGVKGPQDEQQEEQRREAAMRRRSAQYERLIPADAMTALRQAKDAAQLKAAFEKNVADAAARTRLYLQLYGCDEGSWNHSAALDKPLNETLLPGVSSDVLVAAVGTSLADPAAANGAARWFFGNGKWKALDTKAREELLPALATQALSHPRAINRRRTLRALGELKGEPCVAVLRKVLADGIQVRELPKVETAEPGGMVEFGPNDGEVKDEVSDCAYAALLLGKLGDKDSLAAIRALAEKAQGEEKAVLDKAAKMLNAGRD